MLISAICIFYKEILMPPCLSLKWKKAVSGICQICRWFNGQVEKMKPLNRNFKLLLPLLLVFTTGCVTTPPFDYSSFRNHRPRSILVLPPLNQTTDVNAPYTYLSTITRPLAECGYYVFPVAVVDAYMKENGLPSPEEMHGVALDKIRNIIGADAVLYVTIEEWGQKYIVVQSVTTIKAIARLIDTASGKVIWQRHTGSQPRIRRRRRSYCHVNYCGCHSNHQYHG